MITLMLASVVIGFSVLAALVLSSSDKSVSRRVFLLILVLMIVWTLGLLIFLSDTEPLLRYFAAKFFYAASAAFAPLLLLFALSYPTIIDDWKSKRLRLFIWVAVIGIVTFIFANSHFVLSYDVIKQTTGFTSYTIDKPSYVIFGLYFASFFLTAMIVSFRRYFKSTGVARATVGLYAFGMLLSSIPGFFVDMYLPYHGNYSLIWIGPLATFIFVLLVAYSILKHHMFDVQRAAIRSVTYILSVTALLFVYAVIAYTASLLFLGQSFASATGAIWNIGIALLLALLFQPIKSFFDHKTSQFFYRHSYSEQEFTDSIGTILTSHVDLEDLLRSVLKHIVITMSADAGLVTVKINESDEVTVGTGMSEKEVRELAWQRSSRDVTVVSRMNKTPSRARLEEAGIALIVPLIYKEVIIGKIVLGPRRSSLFTSRDVAVLKSITPELAVAIQNAKSLRSIQSFNDKLKEEVERATAELRASNQKLKQLDQTKDEFISLTSHQLRTPLTTIKGYISMLLDGDAGELAPQQRKLLEEAFNSSQRMVHLISDFLNISRIQTGKFEIELSEVNLADILNEEIDQLRISATSRQLRLDYDKPEHFPILPVDEGKIRQVMMNFIDNAIYYSPSGSSIRIILAATTDAVEFKVIDHGIGVPKAEQHKLFTKFSRASNAKKQRPDGTGIGLFMAKKVIVALGGSILFESKEGVGSTFGFRLNRVSSSSGTISKIQ